VVMVGKLGKGITKGHGETRWKLEAERVSFSFPGALKTYANL
jgi:hypothetical protein